MDATLPGYAERMLRVQGRAILALGALSLVLSASVADAVELPANVNLQVNPNPLRPGDDLTISGNANAISSPVCLNGQIRLTRPQDPTFVYSFGSSFNAGAPFSITERRLTRLGVPVEFEAGTYNIALECTSTDGSRDTYTASQVLTVDPNAPAATTSSTAADTTSSSSATTSSSSATTSPSTTATSSTASTSPSTTAPSTSATTVPTGTQGTVEPSTAKPTVTGLVLRGGGFAPNIELRIALTSTPLALGTTMSSAGGFYAASLTLPANAPPGEHEISVTGTDPAGASRTTSAALTIEDLNCGELTAEAAQSALGPEGADPHGLDADQDGQACESGADLTSLGDGDGGGGGGGRSATAGSQAASASGNLARTGTGRAPRAAMAGMTGVVLGALLVGLSQPVQPAAAAHLRPRVAGGRGRRRGNHFAAGTSDLLGRFGPAGVLRRIRQER